MLATYVSNMSTRALQCTDVLVIQKREEQLRISSLWTRTARTAQIRFMLVHDI
jgi:hypothetical protein